MAFILGFFCGVLSVTAAYFICYHATKGRVKDAGAPAAAPARIAESKTKTLLENIERYDGSAKGQKVIR